MKLSRIALPVIAVLGIGAVGGSWYTGKLAEEKYIELVELGNHNLKGLAAYGIEAQIKEVKLVRHFFSSDVNYILEAKYAGQSYVFNGNDKLYHGPFPINRLSKGNIVPVMMSTENKLSVSENLKVLFNNQDEVLTGQANIGYAGDVSGNFDTKALKLADDSFSVSETKSEYEYDKSGNGKVKVSVPFIKGHDSESGIRYDLGDSEIVTSFIGDKTYSYLGLGEYDFKAKSFVLYNESEKQNIALKDMTSKGKNSVKDNRFHSVGDFSAQVEEVRPEEAKAVNWGKVSLDLAFESDAKLTNDMMPYFADSEKAESPEAMKALEDVVTNDLKLHIKPLAFENAKGKNEFTLVLNLAKFNPNDLKEMDDMLTVFKQSVLDVKLNLASLEELNTQVKMTRDNVSRESAEQESKLMVNELVNQAKSGGVAVVDSESIKMNLAIDNGKVTLNGREVPQEEIQNALFMLMLGLGSMQ
ncbi:YdgA family protein [Glaesserella sp.]|uniref:YdgA family protein n=1 Tax=Glaesserella sp. TaxID=2094731 RepID=UPI0035A0ED44